MTSSLLGPMFQTVQDICAEDEWDDLLQANPYLKTILEKWERYLPESLRMQELQEFPFSQEEVEYLSSPFIDELSKLYGCIDTLRYYHPKFNPLLNLLDRNRRELYLERVLHIACSYGFLHIVRWLVEDVYLVHNISTDYANNLVRVACGTGQLEVFKYLRRTFPLTNLKPIYLYYACCNGNIDLVKYLVVEEGIQPASLDEIQWPDPFILDVSCINGACYSGNLDLVKWIYSIYPKNLGKGVDASVRAGRLEVLQWLTSLHPQVYYPVNSAIQVACPCGHLEIIKWLVETYPEHTVEENGIAMGLKYLYFESCGFGNLELAQWFCQRFPSVIGQRGEYNPFVHACRVCAPGSLEVAKWLLEIFPDYKNDIEEAKRANRESMWKTDRLKNPILCWLESLCEPTGSLQN